MALEGELRVGLRVSGGRIASVRIDSTRPDVARALLQGRTRHEVQTAVPLLFAICGRSQAAASELACTAAAGDDVGPDLLTRCSAAVAAEIVRESAWRTLLDWPKGIGEQPTEEAVAAARGALAFRVGAAADDGAEAVAAAAFGCSAGDWLALQTVPELDRWIDAGQTAAARFLRSVRDEDARRADTADRAASRLALLDAQQHAGWIGELAPAIDADPDFARHPSWRGAPAETGALARLQSDPLVGQLMRSAASPVTARFVARLRELALLLTGRTGAAVGALPCAGGGVAWVENARGLLIHQVRLDQGRVRSYRIVAPTEWNFHPAGALASALVGAPAGDLDAVERRTTRLVHSLDPCVACRVEFDDA